MRRLRLTKSRWLLPAILGGMAAIAAGGALLPSGGSAVETRADAMPPAPSESPDPLKNAYFGDLHVHTKISVDAYLQKAMLTMADAYNFASGQTVIAPDGQPVRLKVPLDFVALTDHSENYAFYDLCVEGNGPQSISASCKLAKEQRGAGTYTQLGNLEGAENCDGRVENCQKAKQRTWHYVRWLADQYNRPGSFTTFPAYEYSAAGGPSGYSWHVHRNVIFANKATPDTVFTALDSNLAADLWAWLERSCVAPCDVVAIPHNANLSSGMQFGLETADGGTYTKTDWERRARFERLVEVYQIKGDSECRSGFGTTDEMCSMEQFSPKAPPCSEGVTPADRPGCVAEGSFARNALKLGLALKTKLGFNPFEFGFIGSTDNHNSLPGSTEADNYRGWRGAVDGSPDLRLEPANITSNPGGLAGVWATQNTREAIFAGLKSRETFATSGTRMKVRFFAGWNWQPGAEQAADWVQTGYETGVPMGSVMGQRPKNARPSFMVHAEADGNSAPLQRLQIIKGWIENDTVVEQVHDVACAKGKPDRVSHRCPDITAEVDSQCRPDWKQGSVSIRTTWRDENFRPEQSAFYYVRAIENPSCRWSTFEALRLGRPLSPLVPRTVQQRAWSSPIWYHP